MMKMRTINPAAGTARAKVIQYDQPRLKYISTHKPKSGPAELMICQILRFLSGKLYRETIDRHPMGGVCSSEFDLLTAILSFPLKVQKKRRKVYPPPLIYHIFYTDFSYLIVYKPFKGS